MNTVNIEDLQRLPGLFAAWDLARVILPGSIWWVEDAGLSPDGASLFAIYQVIVAGMVP